MSSVAGKTILRIFAARDSSVRGRLSAQWPLTFESVWQVVDSLSWWGGQSCPQPTFKPVLRRVETRRRPGLAAPQENPPSGGHSVLNARAVECSICRPTKELISAIGLVACGDRGDGRSRKDLLIRGHALHACACGQGHPPSGLQLGGPVGQVRPGTKPRSRYPRMRSAFLLRLLSNQRADLLIGAVRGLQTRAQDAILPHRSARPGEA